MAEYLEYDCQMQDIPEQDSPDPGMIYIRQGYGFESWVVAEWEGKPLGLIYDIENARKFAKAL